MKYFSQLIFLTAGLILLNSCSKQGDLYISHSNPQIEYSGRIDSSQTQATDLYWSGTSVKINFEGQSIGAILKDEKGANYYNIIIDRDSILILKPDTIKRYHQLVSGLKKGKHSLEIFRRTEWSKGKTSFYGFRINGKGKILTKSTPKKRKIEFYGNSITAGYAVEDFSGKDSPDSTFTNNYLSYAAITARHFDAEYSCICKGGIGIMLSWFPYTMPDIYNRLNPADSTSKWDFSNYTPDIVVINLFQNDSWLVHKPERKEFQTKFGTEPPNNDFIINSYKQFVSSIRYHYPQADIICALGNMDATREGSQWPDYIKQAVKTFKDEKIHTLFIPYKNTPGHPSIKEQEIIANSLIQFIDDNIK